MFVSVPEALVWYNRKNSKSCEHMRGKRLLMKISTNGSYCVPQTCHVKR